MNAIKKLFSNIMLTLMLSERVISIGVFLRVKWLLRGSEPAAQVRLIQWATGI